MIQLLTIIAYVSSSMYILKKKTRQRASTLYSLFKNIKILKIFQSVYHECNLIKLKATL